MHRRDDSSPDVFLSDSPDGTDNATKHIVVHSVADDFQVFVQQWSRLRSSTSGDDLTALQLSDSGSSSACDSATLDMCAILTKNTPVHADVHHTTPMHGED